MKRTTALNAVPNKFGAGKSGFRRGNLAEGVKPTEFEDDWFDNVQEEQATLIEAAGLTLNGADMAQVYKALFGSRLWYATDTGSANAYAVAFAPGVPARVDGMQIRFKATNANTGASTLNFNALGAKPILGAGHEALQGGEIVASGLATVTWSAPLDSWVLHQSTGGAQPVALATSWRHAVRRDQTVGDGGTALQLVTGSRAIGVTYTNTSARPRIVIIDLNISSGVARAYVGVQEVWFFSGAGGFTTGFLIVPPGATYTVGGVSGSASVEYWLEY